MQIKNSTRNSVIAIRADRATSVLARARGLMFRSVFPEGSALVIDPCSSIHMFWMRFPIDVLYVDKNDTIVRIQRSIRPWRVGPLYTRGARYVVELPVGVIDETETQVGDVLEYS